MVKYRGHEQTVRYLSAVLAIAISLISASAAFGFKGKELTKLCQKQQVFQDVPASSSIHICLFYILGVLDHAEVYASVKEKDKMFCLPKGTGASKVREKFLKWVEGKDLGNEGAGKSLIAALVETFPCN